MDLLPFQRQIIEELLEPANDGLLILARGLGLRRIVCRFLKEFNERSGTPQLILLLNLPEGHQEDGIKDELAGLGGIDLETITGTTPALERAKLYRRGGILSVTDTVMNGDLMDDTVPIELCSGIVIWNAHEVRKPSHIEFIVRKFREKNKVGFLKAFSDQPELFTHGIAPLEGTLKALKIRQVFLYPRFHELIKKDLETRKADLAELCVGLSEAMQEIQQAIFECMTATINELKRSHLTIDIESFTLEHALVPRFDEVARAQVYSSGGKSSGNTAGLLDDIRTLRGLLLCLLTEDSVSFLRRLDMIKMTKIRNPAGNVRQNVSPWLTLPAADLIFSIAERRVAVRHAASAQPAVTRKSPSPDEFDGITAEEEEALRLYDPAPGESMQSMSASGLTTRPANGLPDLKDASKPWWIPKDTELILEVQPKWEVLAQTLAESENLLFDADPQPDIASTDTILVMCKNSQTSSLLKRYVTADRDADTSLPMADQVMLTLYQHYLRDKKRANNITRNLRKKPANGTAANDHGSVDSRPKTSAALQRKQEYKRGAPANKRRRTRGGAAVAVPRGDTDSVIDLDAEAAALPTIAAKDLDPALADSMIEDFDKLAFDDYFGLIDREDIVIIRPYAGEDDTIMLEELMPKFIIMYEPNLSFVRQIEAYRNSHPGVNIRVYWMTYDTSAEESLYLTEIRAEKDAFERLIRERASMVIPLEAEVRPGEETNEELIRTVTSRIGGGGVTLATGKPKIIIDRRENRAHLYNVLDSQGVQLLPLTLAVGDYILSPEIAVERKSIPDLISSMNEGRLYAQCEHMGTYYELPILLVDFEEREFRLSAHVESKFSDGADEYDLESKLILLTMQLPRLRIIWSSSRYQTAKIFAELKQQRAEPDPEKIKLVGEEEWEGDNEPLRTNAQGLAVGPTGAPVRREYRELSQNQTPVEILLSLPGINTKNYRYVMGKVTNLAELAQMSAVELGILIGVEAGKTLWTFLNKDTTTA
ncbi:uncharacterized protein L969DRAFT_92247 [Mixia osmundae IAM 14324]|uniref:ERCC4 domain-containing protein n=1 Tax=Mixia osmundae (strain CBS 9802 / IAM 14324 / JCM 22182 / KY 12970) TaxID=764103 RepID=G7DTJ0_MIXOS|nr:uncharacterized protein L969DRAFT_92247 [Mixia osmundae IAM 14324]KEI42826.1 hypothetical protein L969DRAFT_92247 [Mixia osmundae IAM 14324]GAA93837.1 hypothetical protein E5Q_00483 [Mixia osmundae IAM 14324]